MHNRLHSLNMHLPEAFETTFLYSHYLNFRLNKNIKKNDAVKQDFSVNASGHYLVQKTV